MLRVRSNGGSSAQQGGGSARLTRLDDYIYRPPGTQANVVTGQAGASASCMEAANSSGPC